MGSHSITVTPRPLITRKPRMTRRQRLAWLAVAVALGAVVAGIVTAAVHRPVAAPPAAVTAVPLAAPASEPAPELESVRIEAGSYTVTDSPIPEGSYVAPGGQRCAWSVRNAAGSLMQQGSGTEAQRVDLRAGMSLRISGCGGWTKVAADAPK